MSFRGNHIQQRPFLGLLVTAILCLPSQQIRAEGAGAALGGAAAIIAATSPMVITAIQEGSQTKITAMEAASNVKTTAMKLAADEANNTRSALLSLLQTQAAERINYVNQQYAFASLYAVNAAKVAQSMMQLEIQDRDSQRNYELELAKVMIDAKVAKEKRDIEKMMRHLDLVKAGLTTMANVTVGAATAATGSLSTNPISSNRLLASLGPTNPGLSRGAAIVKGDLADAMASNNRVRGSFRTLLPTKGRSALSSFQVAMQTEQGEPTPHRAFGQSAMKSGAPELRHNGQATAAAPQQGKSLRVIGDEQ